MNDFNRSMLVIGQTVFCSLYGGRHGVILNITGHQQPNSVKDLCGVAVTGGSASFDIVFYNGTLSKGVPEAIIRGVQWKILDEVVDQERIDRLLSHHEAVSQSAEKNRHDKRVSQDLLRERLRQEFPYLKQVSNDVRHAKTGAANIRIELKRAFPHVKFSVRMSGGCAINIGWCDGPTKDQVEALVGKYQEGRFNSMEDIYERNTGNVWPGIFGGDRYISQRREYSDRLIQIAIDREYEENSFNYSSANINKPSVEDFRSGRLFNISDPLLHSNGRTLQSDIHARLSEYSEAEAIQPCIDSSVGTTADHENHQVRKGAKPGYVEIVFNDKPGSDVRMKLKEAGFRWSPANNLWYGKSVNLPQQFAL